MIASVVAQEVITNAGVVEMVKAGLPEEIIIAKIQAGTGAFNTTTTALKELSEAGVPTNVIVAMIAEAGKSSRAAALSDKEDQKLLKTVPEQGKLIDVVGKSKVYILTEDLKARDRIEKQIAKVKRFSVVDRIEECDFVIKYESWVETVNVSATVVGNTATARENTQIVGILTVMMPSESAESGRLRLVYSARKTKYFVWEDNPAESTAKQFIKDLTKAIATGTKP